MPIKNYHNKIFASRAGLNNKILFKCRRVRFFARIRAKRSRSKIAYCNSESILLQTPFKKSDSVLSYVLHLCLLIYSCKAFSNFSLILRVEPVSLTTNFIHSVHICLSTFMDVFVFLSPCRTSFTTPYAVNKVNGYYRKLNIILYGKAVWRYYGINSDLRGTCNSSQDDLEER
jgi:hypothetical protein